MMKPRETIVIGNHALNATHQELHKHCVAMRDIDSDAFEQSSGTFVQIRDKLVITTRSFSWRMSFRLFVSTVGI
jgi:hypothetical protein